MGKNKNISNGFSIIAKADAKTKVGYITMTGVVANFDYEDQYFKASTFLKEYNKLKETCNHIHIDIVNLYGGSIYEGFPVYEAIANETDVKITGKVDGLAASMGSVIALAIPAENLEMGKFARLMIHRAKGGSYGTGDEVVSQGNEILKLENDLAEIFASRTGLSIEDVKAKWFDGLDHYINSKECIDLGLIGKAVNSSFSKAPTKALLENPSNVFNFYNNQLNNENDNMKNLALFIAAIVAVNPNFNQEASEEEVLKEFQNLISKGKQDAKALGEAQAELDAAQAEKVTDLISNAIRENKISEKQKEAMTKMASNDFEGTKTFLDNQTARLPINAMLNGGKQNTPGAKPADTEMTFNDWRKKDAAGLAKMKKEDFAQYSALYEAQYGNPPNA